MTAILAKNITHLTDARYFAAMEVAWLCFDLATNELSPEAVHAIVEWVEGPQIAVENMEQEMDELIFRLHPIGFVDPNTEGILQLQLADLLEVPYSLSASAIIIHNANVEELEAAEESLRSMDNQLYLSANLANDEWIQLVHDLPFLGIVVNGSQEEKVGFKEFDDLDDLFERLRPDQ